jgi:hypothetical protein
VDQRDSPRGELTTPQRPAFIEELLCIPDDDVVHSLGGELQILHGPAANWIVTNVVPLLDGTRTAADLARALPELTEESVHDVLAVLGANGMLEAGRDHDGRHPSVEPDNLTSQLAFFSRYLGVTRRFTHRSHVQRSLDAATVGILGDASHVPALAAAIEAMGMHTIVRTVPDSRLYQAEPAGADIGGDSSWAAMDLLACVGDVGLQKASATQCLTLGVPMLSVDPTRLIIGPLMRPGLTACPTCVQRQIAVRGDSTCAEPRSVRRLRERALLARTCQHVLAQVTGLFEPPSLTRLELWDLRPPWRYQYPIHRDRKCQTCGDF